MAELDIELKDHVAVITLNRPAKRNAFTPQMLADIVAFLDGEGRSERCRAIVLTGAAGTFCSGVDLAVAQALHDLPEAGRALEWKNLLFEKVQQVALAIERCDRPIIAAVSGNAVGAGMDLALMCDMRFADTSARFCEAYVNLGVVPGDGGCYYLPRIVGLPKALELLLGGETVEAPEALAMGLVNRVYPPDQLLARTVEFAARLASKSPTALQMTKRTAIQSLKLDLRTSLDLVSSHMGIVQTMPATSQLLHTQIGHGKTGVAEK